MAGGACFWALYLVTYKKFVGDPSHTTINVQSTLVGLISVFFSWPVLFILHYTGAEKFELPSGTPAERRPSALDPDLIPYLSFFTGGLQIGILVATTFLVFCNNYMFTFGVALTAPGFVTIGTTPCSSFHAHNSDAGQPSTDTYSTGWGALGSMLAIPASAIVDRFVRDVAFPPLKIGTCSATTNARKGDVDEVRSRSGLLAQVALWRWWRASFCSTSTIAGCGPRSSPSSVAPRPAIRASRSTRQLTSNTSPATTHATSRSTQPDVVRILVIPEQEFLECWEYSRQK